MTRAVAPDAGPFGRKRKVDDFEWETSKENVMPLKRGRNVDDLNKALRAHNSFQTKLRLEDELKAKEDDITAYKGDDPLVAWIEYVRWLEVKMPEDTRKKFTALEKCTRKLKDNPRYTNDIRYVRLWIQYADLVSNPKDIFKYLYQNKIGEKVSLFYIGWAYVLETMANYPQAHKIYLKASQKHAEPQDLLERKYKEFQRRMSRQWLRMTEETGASDMDEVTHRRALESLSTYGILELNDAQRQQLHQHQASVRAQRVQKANAHKPVFVIYEDPVGHSVDPFDGNGGWKKLGTLQQQDKENELAPSAWNPPGRQAGAREVTGVEAGRQPDQRPPTLTGRPCASPLQVFVDDEFSVPESETKRRTPLTHRSQTLRQRMEGVATEEEMLAQEPLKNFTASDKKARSHRQGPKGRLEKPYYDVELMKAKTGEECSFEEARARSFHQFKGTRRKLGHRALQNVTHRVESVSNAVAPSATSISSATTSITSHRSRLSERKPIPTPPNPPEPKLPERKPVHTTMSGAIEPKKPISAHNNDQEDMTINTRVALEDINSMFCSPPRQPKPISWEAKDDDPVERKLHFSIVDDSVDSVAVNAQDQSVRQDPNESIPKQTFQVFNDDAPVGFRQQPFRVLSDDPQPGTKQPFQIYSDEAPQEPPSEKKTWSQKRKPLTARDDLVRGGHRTNKDVLMEALKDAAEKDSSESVKQTLKGASSKYDLSRTTKDLAPAHELDPYTFENRQALILARQVDWYLCSRPDSVKLHSQKLPRIPCNNPAKRKLRKPIAFKADSSKVLQLVGVLGSGSFAYVFSANIIDTSKKTTRNKAVKIEKERHNLAWEFYITNKIKKKLRIDHGLPEEHIPVPTFTGLHLFPNGSLLIMDKGHVGTLFDVLNCYKQSGVIFPEVLTIYYGIKMLHCIELLHSVNILHGDIKPDNWLMIPGKPEAELSMDTQELSKTNNFKAGDLYLIDYGRSIDLSFYPDGTVFRGNCHAKGFQCIEMLTQLPWTHQIDTFAFLGTIHCMLFGEYMEVKPRRNSKGVVQWGIVKPFKRYWQVDMWKDIFHELLNVSSCSEQPSLLNLRRRLENYFETDASRQQELFKQLTRQDSFLRKSSI